MRSPHRISTIDGGRGWQAGRVAGGVDTRGVGWAAREAGAASGMGAGGGRLAAATEGIADGATRRGGGESRCGDAAMAVCCMRGGRNLAQEADRDMILDFCALPAQRLPRVQAADLRLCGEGISDTPPKARETTRSAYKSRNSCPYLPSADKSLHLRKQQARQDVRAAGGVGGRGRQRARAAAGASGGRSRAAGAHGGRAAGGAHGGRTRQARFPKENPSLVPTRMEISMRVRCREMLPGMQNASKRGGRRRS